ncbi:hypothetical protein D3C87_240860 [compost metagenome]
MKALNQQELQTFVDTFNPVLEGAQLQDILSNDRGLALGFRKQVHFWLILDLVPNTPMMLLFQEECPFKKAAKPKPLSLFLNSHGKNLLFEKMEVLTSLGRVVRLFLKSSQKSVELEIRLIPKQCNLLVRADGKSIAWEKPLDLKEAPALDYVPEVRSLEEIHSEWLKEQNSSQKNSLDPVAQWEKQKEKDLEKKRKALVEIQKQLEAEKEILWYEAGEWLKAHGSLEVPEHLTSFIDRRESLSWNMENCFFKAKQALQKKEGARTRLEELEKEVLFLEKSRYQDKSKKPVLVDLMKKADARGRKLHLKSGAIAYCGKSGADNLALLRQAKAWDYWLHLKDYPGAHAIIHRQRDQVISEEELNEVSDWVARESLSSKSLILGQKMAVVVVETRFVRPIKGDKLGRVTYHSERTLNLTLRQD